MVLRQGGGGELLAVRRAPFSQRRLGKSVDPTVDIFKDGDVTISSLFTIQPTETSISVENRKETIGKLTRQVVIAVEKASPPKGAVVTVSYLWWFRVVVFPKGFDVSKIHRLADVQIHGGQILKGGGQSTGIFMVEKKE